MEREAIPSEAFEISREDLYEQVWVTPINHLAAKFGVSDFNLVQVCRALNVPRPPAGYWQKKAVGRAPPRPELPAAQPGNQLRWAKDKPFATPVKKRVRRAVDLTTAIKSPKPARHPMLIGVEESFRKSRTTEENEFLRPYKQLLPDIVASETRLERALELANEIYRALDQKRLRVLIAPPDQEMVRIHIEERETPGNDRKYGRYQFGSIWSPHRPTITYIGSIPIGLALTEMTERAALRYLDGRYVREDSKLVQSAKPWQLTHSWTTEQDLPCGRFRFVAYSPLAGVDWTANWQETQTASMSTMVSAIVQKLESVEEELRALMRAAEEAAARRRQELKEAQERYRREEDQRRVVQASAESKKQLAEIMEKWAAATAVERFFLEAQSRVNEVEGERRAQLAERLALARSMVGAMDPLAFLAEWLAPEERYKSKYGKPD
jgi:outer membrane murein-binding lipoprotein Lpp